MPRLFYFCGHEQFQPEVLVEHAVRAEAAGFDGVAVSEHFHPWVDDVGAGGFAYATLGAMAVRTSHVALVTTVSTPLFRYHPGVVAQAAATVDRLSGGRFELGVGTGENLNEGPLGYPFPAYDGRAARMEEALDIIGSLLAGDRLTYRGEHYSTERARLYSPPRRAVPLWMAAGGPKSAALAARKADGIISSVREPAATAARVIAPAREAAAEAGRSRPRLMATRWAVFAGDRGQAWEALRPWRGLRAPGRLGAVDPAELREKADSMPRDEILDSYPIAASPDEIVAVYRPLVTELEADTVVVQMTALDQEDLIEMLGAEVLPRLRLNS